MQAELDALTRRPGVTRLSAGSVRERFAVGEELLLLVATDRISAFDTILPTPIPDKGRVLTALSAYWLRRLSGLTPTHLVSTTTQDFPPPLDALAHALDGRAMLCRRARMVPLECVVRGYLAGSAWQEYRRTGGVAGQGLPRGLRQAQALPEPLFTPTTKEQGGHDQPLTGEQARQRLGADLVEQLAALSLGLYTAAAAHAAERGLILADTKFEFGFIDGRLALADEVATPDSSRYWRAGEYAPGRPQRALDKQVVRDWLLEQAWDQRPPAPELPPALVRRARARYLEAHERLTGRSLDPRPTGVEQAAP